MNTANEIAEELNSMGSALYGIPRVMPYSVPVGYFENFAADALNTIHIAGEADPLTAWSKATSFSTPEGYFEGLTDNIVSAVKTEQIRSLSFESMPYSVPAGFFENLPGKMLQAAKKAHPFKKETARIPLGRNAFSQIRWAAAAVLLVCIGLGGYFTFYTQHDNTENMLASVPSNDIRDYVQHSYILDVNKMGNNEEVNNIEVDNKDIIQYLNETGWDVME